MTDQELLEIIQPWLDKERRMIVTNSKTGNQVTINILINSQQARLEMFLRPRGLSGELLRALTLIQDLQTAYLVAERLKGRPVQ